MFNWPVLSAALGRCLLIIFFFICAMLCVQCKLTNRVYIWVLGITANLFFIALSCLMSWYQIINSEEYLSYMEASEKVEVLNNGKYFRFVLCL